jgi:hypothetical protein
MTMEAVWKSLNKQDVRLKCTMTTVAALDVCQLCNGQQNKLISLKYDSTNDYC